MTPMQKPINVLAELIRHFEEMKHASVVYQFQNICELLIPLRVMNL